MANLGFAKEVIKSTLKYLPELNTISSKEKTNNLVKIENTKLPNWIDKLISNLPKDIPEDNMVMEIINTCKLRNPENMVRFLVELHFAQLESIYDNFSTIVELDLINSLSFVKAAKDDLKNAFSESNTLEKERQLKSIRTDLNKGYSQLTDKALLYIQQVETISKRNFFGYIVHSISDLKTAKTSTKCAKVAINAIIETVNIQNTIAAELNDNNYKLSDYESFKNQLTRGGENAYNLLMMRFDDTEKSPKKTKTKSGEIITWGYWGKLPDLLSGPVETSKMLNKYIDNTDNSDLNFDNIIFN